MFYGFFKDGIVLFVSLYIIYTTFYNSFFKKKFVSLFLLFIIYLFFIYIIYINTWYNTWGISIVLLLLLNIITPYVLNITGIIIIC
jgi:hypothetical protein